jgi:hypothetical protein
MAQSAPRLSPEEAPRYEPWSVFRPRFVGRWRQGQHCLFDGPTGSGKTVAARVLARDRQFVCVLGTKIRDPEMSAYVEEGYTRVESWPPPRKALRPLRDGSVRVILWPQIKTRLDLRRFRAVYQDALDKMLVDGGWTIVADEGLWLSERKGLDLGDPLGAIAYTGRSSDVTLMVLLQRPSGVPRVIWQSCSHAFIWHGGVPDDQRQLASLGTAEPRAVVRTVGQLRGHQFLYLPCRAGAEWAISQVDL